MTLYELSEEVAAIESDIVDAGGEIDDATAARLTALDMAWEDKVEAIVHLIRESETWAESARAEERRIAALRQTRERTAGRLKEWLLVGMRVAGRARIDTPTCRVTVSRSAPSVVCALSPEELPAEYVRVIPESREIDRRALLDAHKAGLSLPEGVTIAQGAHLLIR